MVIFNSVLSVLFVLIGSNCINNKIPDQTGMDYGHQQIENTDTMNGKEISILNSILKNSRDTFDFERKQVAFISGSSGSKILTKSYFFNNCIYPWIEKEERPQVSMILLNEEEKKLSGGYDVLVLAWVKSLSNKQKQKILVKLSLKK